MKIRDKIKTWYWRLKFKFNNHGLITVNENAPINLRLPPPKKDMYFAIENIGKSTLTILAPTDENKSVEIDGVSRKILNPGEGCFIFSDGEDFYGVYARSPEIGLDKTLDV